MRRVKIKGTIYELTLKLKQQYVEKMTFFYFFRLIGDEVCLACSFFFDFHCDFRKKGKLMLSQERKETWGKEASWEKGLWGGESDVVA